MHAVLVTYGSLGDLNPFIGLGARLRARGHDVTMIVGANLKAFATGHGFKVLAYGTEDHFRVVFGNPSFWTKVRGMNIVGRSICECMAGQYEAIAAQRHLGDVVLLAHPLAFGARVAHDRLGLPLVTILLSPANVPSAHRMPLALGYPSAANSLPLPLKRRLVRIGARAADRVLGRSSINAFRARVGLEPLTQPIMRWWLSPQQAVALFPDWYGTPQPDWPGQIRVTSFPRFDPPSTVSPELRAFLDDGEPPVLFTLGSRMAHGRAFFRAAVEACALLSRRGVLVTESVADVPRQLPAHLRHFDHIPFGAVLKEHAAIVHHGGIGTLAQGMAAGIPQLIMPMAFDQSDNADRARRLGVGAWLSPRSHRPHTIARKLRYLLDSDRVAERCAAVAKELADVDPIADACQLIESCAGGSLEVSDPAAAGASSSTRRRWQSESNPHREMELKENSHDSSLRER